MSAINLNSRSLVYLLIPIVLIGPISMDMFLPAIPSIRQELGVSVNLVQWTLSGFVLGFGLSQLFVGFLSNRFGTSNCLIWAILCYGVASVCCALSHNIYGIIFFRFIQAMTACITTVLSMAIVRKSVDNLKETVRAYSILSGTTALAPIFAPIVGAQLMIFFHNWQSIFITLGAFSFLGLIIFIFIINPRLPSKSNTKVKLKVVFASYIEVFKSGEFWTYALVGAVGMTILFSFFSIAPLLFIDENNFSVQEFSALFGCYGLFFLFGTMVGPRLVTHLGNLKSLLFAYSLNFILCSLILIIPYLERNIYGFLVIMMLINFSLGITFGPALSGAMNLFKDEAEQAASIYGFQQFIIAFLVATSLEYMGMIHPKEIAWVFLLLCGLLILRLTYWIQSSSRTR